jgi:dolichyl-phosphate beta-glucosyltransferase
MEYSIVIPVFNESDKISQNLTQVVGFMRTFSKKFEVVVVDDGSRDNTAKIVSNYAKDNPEVKLVKNPHKGKGYTVLTGMKKAKGDLVYMADADLSTPIEELKKLSIWIKEHEYDIVIASREGVGANRVDEPFYRHLMGRVFNLVVQLVAIPGIKDTQCGFKLFTNDAAQKVFGMLDIYGDDTQEIEEAYLGAWDVEVLFIAKKLGYRIKEIPVKWVYVKTTRLSPLRDSFKMFVDVVKVRLNDLKGKYKAPPVKN